MVLVLSCNLFGDSSSDKTSRVVAKVYEEKLYEDDLKELFPVNLSSEDSVVVARDLINSWAKEQLLMLKSELNMPSNNPELEKLVKKYRRDLFINSFKEALIKQKLDTIVTSDQIMSYYNENKVSFKINEELVKFKYIQIADNNKNKSKLKRLFIARGRNDLQMLDEEGEQFISSFLSDSVWVRYSDVLNKLPFLREMDKSKVIAKSKFLQKKDSTGLYYVYMVDILKENEIAPIRYISKVIEKMLLHKRKLELVNTIEEVLVDDAIKNKQFEIY
jgi:hypothetical protein